MITLVTGGARSGKSRFAEYFVASRSSGENVGYIATGLSLDDEMAERIREHQVRRGKSFVTIEEPTDVAERIAQAEYNVYLVDCLSFLLNNWLYAVDYAVADIPNRIVELTNVVRETSSDVIFVTNEVGMGLVPPSDESRVYRDWLGRMNQAIAREADEVYLVVAGYAVDLKRVPGVQMVPGTDTDKME